MECGAHAAYSQAYASYIRDDGQLTGVLSEATVTVRPSGANL